LAFGLAFFIPLTQTEALAYLDPGTGSYIFFDIERHPQKREGIILAFAKLSACASDPSPKLIFAHILCPHPPFVFGPNGEQTPVNQQTYLRIGRDHWSINKPAYVSQIKYTNKITLETIDRILARSIKKPIIIIQGDHSLSLDIVPDIQAGKRLPDETAIKARMGILNAYLLPAACPESIVYDSISPVNSYRMIFNYYFDTSFPRLDDKHFYSPDDMIFRFTDVTGIVKFNERGDP